MISIKMTSQFTFMRNHFASYLLMIFGLLSFGSVFHSISWAGNPFELPQTNFYFGSLSMVSDIQAQGRSVEIDLRQGGINGYGFEIEVNHSSFMSIGAGLRVDSISKENSIYAGVPLTLSKTSFLLDGFTRFYCALPFLKQPTSITRVFSRIDLAGGPFILNGIESSFMGLLFQPGLHVGLETYFNPWIGASVSYGQVYEIGSGGMKGYDLNLYSRGQILQVALKTTFF